MKERERNMPFVESRQLFKGEQKMESICVCYGGKQREVECNIEIYNKECEMMI